MANFPYLVAIALIDQGGNRSMPLGGKSIDNLKDIKLILDDIGKTIALEILLRVLEKSDKGCLQRYAKDQSILIASIPMELLQSELPGLKNDWLKDGDNKAFISKMNTICESIWSVNFKKYEGIIFNKLEYY